MSTKWGLLKRSSLFYSLRDAFPSLRLGSRQFITHTRAQQVARLPGAFNLSNAVHWTDKRFRVRKNKRSLIRSHLTGGRRARGAGNSGKYCTYLKSNVNLYSRIEKYFFFLPLFYNFSLKTKKNTPLARENVKNK